MGTVASLIKFGYLIVIVTMILIIWGSIASASSGSALYGHRYGALEAHKDDPPCVFNPLCTCSKAVPDLGIVRCRNVPLPRIPPPLNSSKVFMLILENNGLEYFEPHFLEGTGLYHLQIMHNPLHLIPGDAFQGLERSLSELEISHSYLATIPSRAMRHLQKLKYLNLEGKMTFCLSIFGF
ncbi:unnamed protein product [Bemisia tabaci]|uniref:Chaoptin n=1 Tax=Bemisia tabaci TaxID=7038 RepID=A0A9P0C7A9_BEMTA|nr:unnamed protein product [Bemisia tabaci]